MDELFINIMERLAGRMPELSLIDEDYGQLEMSAEEDHYPVTFPCVLIGNIEADWRDQGISTQKGAATITVRLAIDCYDDTSFASGTYDKIRERRKLDTRLYKILKRFKGAQNATPLVRIKSRDYALPGYIKVFETTYAFTINDTTGQML
ncbi:MAG: hypothetical protein HDR92_05140 [Bacteroides sp.]|nr:hypothetical protein [Bacteroides sp.]